MKCRISLGARQIACVGIIAALIMAASSAQTEDSDPKKTTKERYAAAVKRSRESLLNALNEYLEFEQKALKNSISEKDEFWVAFHRRAIADVKKRIDVAKSGKVPVTFEFFGKLQVGDVGIPQETRIIQIISDNEMIVRVEHLESRFSDETMTSRVWLKGFPTKGHADDEVLRLKYPIEIVGTRKYTTVTGAATTVMEGEKLEIPASGKDK